MKNFTRTLIIFTALLSTTYSNAAVIRSIASGPWSSTLSWDLGRAPNSADTVIVEAGFDLTITSSTTIARLEVYNDAGLVVLTSLVTVQDGYTLTVTGDVLISSTVGGVSHAGIQMLVEGVLEINGDLTMTNTLGLLAATNLFQIGTASSNGICTIQGDVTLTNTLSVALGYVNELVVGSGDLTIEGNITQSAGTLALLGTNRILVNDDGSFNGTSKRIYFKGTTIDNEEGDLEILDGNSNTTFEFHYSGAAAQVLETDNVTYNDVYISNPQYVSLDDNPSNSEILGQLIIANGGTLLIDNVLYNLDDLSGAADKVEALAGGRLKITEAAFSNGVPPAGVSTFAALSYVEFNNTSGSPEEVFQEANAYPIIQLTGSGEKQYKSTGTNIDNSTSKVGRLEALEGIFSIEPGLDFTLNNTYGDKVFLIDSAVTVEVKGDFASFDSYGDFHRYSTISFEENGTPQAIVPFFQADGITFEPYGILSLSTASGSSVNRTLLNTTVQVENKLEIGAQIELILSGTGYLQLLSDAAYTAYIPELPSTAGITYSSTGRFIIGKHLDYSKYSSVALSTPVKDLTLSGWKNRGVYFRGFPGSNNPGASYSNAVFYTESDSGSANEGFNVPTDISDSAVNFDGAGNIVKNSYRINIGSSDIDLRDTGKIITGTKTLNLTFNYTNSGPSSRDDHDGWNTVGNPFPSAISWKKVASDPDNASLFDNGFVSKQIYVYKYNDREDEIPAESSAFGYYHAGTGFEYAQDSVLPSSQGFILKAYHSVATNEQTYGLKIKESHKMDLETSENYKSSEKSGSDNPRETALGIWLEHESNGWGVVFAHEWPKATLAYDHKYDVKRMGAPSANIPYVDFTKNDESLNLNVNAFGDNLGHISLPFTVNTPKKGTYKVKLTNLDLFIAKYGCATLHSLRFDSPMILSEEDTVLYFDQLGVSDDFVLEFSNTLAEFIKTENTSCNDSNDGELYLDGVSFSTVGYSFTLYKDLNVVATQNHNMAFTNLAPGNYVLESNGYINTCTSKSIGITIAAEQIVPDLMMSSDTVEVSEVINFDADYTEPLTYIWTIDGIELVGQNVEFMFTETGEKTVTLTSYQTDAGCETILDTIIYVQSSVGINEEAWKNETTLKYQDGIIVIHTPLEGTTIHIHNVLGQEILNQKIQSKSVSIPITEKGLLFMRLSYEDNSKAFKIKL